MIKLFCLSKDGAVSELLGRVLPGDLFVASKGNVARAGEAPRSPVSRMNMRCIIEHQNRYFR